MKQNCSSIARSTHRARLRGKVILAQLVPLLNLLLWLLGEPLHGNCAPAIQKLASSWTERHQSVQLAHQAQWLLSQDGLLTWQKQCHDLKTTPEVRSHSSKLPLSLKGDIWKPERQHVKAQKVTFGSIDGPAHECLGTQSVLEALQQVDGQQLFGIDPVPVKQLNPEVLSLRLLDHEPLALIPYWSQGVLLVLLWVHNTQPCTLLTTLLHVPC